MNFYELMLLVDEKIKEEEINNLLVKIEDLTKKKGGKILETVHWGKRKLAYEIKKHKEAYYVIILFMLSPLYLKEIEQFYKLNEKIIRYFILKLKQEKQILIKRKEEEIKTDG